jgi:hypothetical protein
LTCAVEVDLDGLFFAFTMADLAGRILAHACGGGEQARGRVHGGGDRPVVRPVPHSGDRIVRTGNDATQPG